MAGGRVALPVLGKLVRLPNVVEAFGAAHPEIALSAGTTGAAYYLFPTDAQLLSQPPPVGPTRLGGHFVALDEALRTGNFDADTLLPGSVGPYVRHGATLALPFAETPWAVRWRADAFAAAGLAPPRATWTLDDFAAACSALRATVRKGKIKGVQGALRPLAFPPPKPDASSTPIPTLTFPGLWQAFVWGFGGTIVAGGRFRLTDKPTVEAMQALVALQQYAAPGPNGYALAFDLYTPGNLPSPWRWARLPRFPANPVVTTLSYAYGMAASRQPPANVMDAAVAFMTWLYTPRALALLAEAGSPPAVASRSSQVSYWRNRPDGGAAAGDWAHFRDCYDGLPTVGSQAVYNAVQSVLFDRATVPAALAAAEEALNSGKPPFRGPELFVNPALGAE